MKKFEAAAVANINDKILFRVAGFAKLR